MKEDKRSLLLIVLLATQVGIWIDRVTTRLEK